MKNPSSVPVLISLLNGASNEIKDAALDALSTIKGHMESSRNGERDKEWKNFYAEPPQSLLSYLKEIELKIASGIFYIRSLERVQKSHPRAVLLLTDALTREMIQKEETALQCIQLIVAHRIINAVSFDLKSSDARTRAEALEVLEESCPEGKSLAKILEQKYFPKPSGRDGTIQPVEFLEQLMAEDLSPWIRACVIYMVGDLRVKEFQSMLMKFQEETDALIVHCSILSLKKLDAKIAINMDEEVVKQMDSRMERILFLRTVPLFDEVEGSVLHWVSEVAEEKKAAAGEVIFKENDDSNALYIILSGIVKVYKEGKKEATLDILQDRDYFGEIGIIDGGPRSTSVVALRESRLLVIKRDDFQRLVMARTKMSFILLKNLCRRFRDTNRNLANALSWMA